ncbi:MAG: ABC-type transport auxiliary lipoprotein family protein [Steroidobacteraceae bacterium]
MNRLLPVVAVAVLCAGCAGSMLDSGNEPPETYRLEGPALVAAGDTLPLALGVARPRSASSLDTERIAVVHAAGGFDYFAGMRWADAAPQMLQSLLVRAFTADGRFATTVASPSRVPTDLLLDVELRRFEAVYATADGPPRVRVELQATLVDSRKGTRLASFLASSEASAERNRQPEVVAAFGVAGNEALQVVVMRVRDATAALPR